MQPTAIVIDLDNTLYEYEPAHNFAESFALEVLSTKLKIDPNVVKHTWLESRSIVKERLPKVAARHSRLLYAEQTLMNLGYGAHPTLALQIEQAYWSRFLAHMKPINGANDFLSTARFHKIPIVLLTDLTSQIQLRKLLRLGWQDAFDFVVTSEFLGYEKESGVSFEFALNQIGMEYRRHVWFIGDQPFDVPDMDRLTSIDLISSGQGFLRKNSRPTRNDVLYFQDFRELEDRLGP